MPVAYGDEVGTDLEFEMFLILWEVRSPTDGSSWLYIFKDTFSFYVLSCILSYTEFVAPGSL